MSLLFCSLNCFLSALRALRALKPGAAEEIGLFQLVLGRAVFVEWVVSVREAQVNESSAPSLPRSSVFVVFFLWTLRLSSWGSCLCVPVTGTFLCWGVTHPEVSLQPQPFPNTAPPAQKWAFSKRPLHPINSCQVPSFGLCELSPPASGFLASRAGRVS